MKYVVPVVVLAAALAGCGSSSHMSGTGADAQALDATAQSIAGAAAAYRSSTATMPDGAACTTAESAYEAQVRPMLQRMHELAGPMDSTMSSMMGPAAADVSCATSAMDAELERHRAMACASPSDMMPNQAEADRHARWMTAWADHQRTRAGQMASGSMQGGGMMGGPAATGTCQRGADGSYSMMGGATMQVPPMGVQGFHAMAQDVAAVAASRGAAAAAMTDLAPCGPAEGAYDAQVRPMVQQLRLLAGDMDAMMGSLGQPALGDMTCGADALLAELDRHRVAACGSDLATAKAEASRHVQAMTSWTNHERVRSEAMWTMMGTGGMMGSGGTTGACLRNADGTFTLQ